MEKVAMIVMPQGQIALRVDVNGQGSLMDAVLALIAKDSNAKKA